MTAKEKFMKRAEELGVTKILEYERAGFFNDDDTITVLEAYEADDEYFEYHYPSFEYLKKLKGFPEACMKHWLKNGDNEFTIKVADWLFNDGDCPMYGLDVYYLDWDFDCKRVEIEFTNDRGENE